MFKNFSNDDVDSGIEIIDCISTISSTACYWYYLIEKGSNSKSGCIFACFNKKCEKVEYTNICTKDIGKVDLNLFVEYLNGKLYLKSNSSSENWSIIGKRLDILD